MRESSYARKDPTLPKIPVYQPEILPNNHFKESS